MTGGLFSLRLYPRLFKEENFIMKLKKIASLALAGVMAVSMLAGCKGGSAVVGGKDDATVPSIVTAVNNGQSAANKVKIEFTTDSTLESAAKQAVALYQDNFFDQTIITSSTNPPSATIVMDYVSKLEDAIEKYASIFDSKDDLSNFYDNEQGGATQTSTEDNDGESNTYLNVVYIGMSPAGDEYIMNTCANAIDKLVAQLDDTNKVVKGETGKDNTGANKAVTPSGNHYQDYSYTGNVCLFSLDTSAGATYYFMATVIEQTVTDHVLEK